MRSEEGGGAGLFFLVLVLLSGLGQIYLWIFGISFENPFFMFCAGVGIMLLCHTAIFVMGIGSLLVILFVMEGAHKVVIYGRGELSKRRDKCI